MSNRDYFGVREPLFKAEAPKKTVSLTINSDLYARTKAEGINASKIAEQALAQELERKRRESFQADVARDVAAVDAYIKKHGSFSAGVRAHFKRGKAGSDE